MNFGKQVKEQGVTDPSQISDMLKKIVADMLRGGEELKIGTKPSVILVIGVNGVGKTTTIGKIAAMLEKAGQKGHSRRCRHVPCRRGGTAGNLGAALRGGHCQSAAGQRPGFRGV